MTTETKVGYEVHYMSASNRGWIQRPHAVFETQEQAVEWMETAKSFHPPLRLVKITSTTEVLDL